MSAASGEREIAYKTELIRTGTPYIVGTCNIDQRKIAVGVADNFTEPQILEELGKLAYLPCGGWHAVKPPLKMYSWDFTIHQPQTPADPNPSSS